MLTGCFKQNKQHLKTFCLLSCGFPAPERGRTAGSAEKSPGARFVLLGVAFSPVHYDLYKENTDEFRHPSLVVIPPNLNSAVHTDLWQD